MRASFNPRRYFCAFEHCLELIFTRVQPFLMAAFLPFAIFKKVHLGMGQLAPESHVSTRSAIRTLLAGNDQIAARRR